MRDLERTLPLTIERGRRTDTRTAVNGVPTLQAFTYVLPSVVAMVTQQYLRYAEAHPPSSPPPPRPRLMGPTTLRYPSPDGWADREDDA
ncbi:hypothetical protein AB8A21_03005 [Streptomyces sp. BF23-18]|uniref:hypothetical protein n=1 Tax=Streptomyces sp. BF23-18 TaxID=3240282 RepID=UPI0034E49D87